MNADSHPARRAWAAAARRLSVSLAVVALLAGTLATAARPADAGSAATQPRSCDSFTQSRQSSEGPYAEGATAENIRAWGAVTCQTARKEIRRCIFHRRVPGWTAVAAVDTNDLPKSQILPTVDASPQMAPLVGGRPSHTRYVTFTVAGGRPQCFLTAVAENVD